MFSYNKIQIMQSLNLPANKPMITSQLTVKLSLNLPYFYFSYPTHPLSGNSLCLHFPNFQILPSPKYKTLIVPSLMSLSDTNIWESTIFQKCPILIKFFSEFYFHHSAVQIKLHIDTFGVNAKVSLVLLNKEADRTL